MGELYTEDEKYMFRCIQLAKNGRGYVGGNPMVGAVVVSDGVIIGEGCHQRYGGPHAEVNAVNSIKDKALLRSSTLYVTLEPCSHFGKTPPCADMIIAMGIPRVIIGCIDPFPEVSGRGIEKLKKAGVEVLLGVLERECRDLIRKFVTYQMLKRPYVLLKWAESADGFMDVFRQGGEAAKISNSRSIMLAHKRRVESDAILVGTNTARLDNPSLTIREWYGKQPVRVVIDRDLQLGKELHLFDGAVRTLVFTESKPEGSSVPPEIEYIELDWTGGVLPGLLKALYERNIYTLMVEGGTILLNSFIDSSLWDEAAVEVAGSCLYEGVKAPLIPGGYLAEEEKHFGSDFKCYRNKNAYPEGT